MPGNCTDTHGNATDANGYGCDAYITSASCKKYDDHDFSSSEMCCKCGGGRFGNSFSISFHRDIILELFNILKRLNYISLLVIMIVVQLK